MKCPVDQTEMDKGMLNHWYGKITWVKSKPFLGVGGAPIVAYKCPKCGKIELKVKEEK